MAGTGPIPIIEGSTPATAIETILAIGWRLYWVMAFSLARINAAAPSFIPEEFPAVTVPSLIKAGLKEDQLDLIELNEAFASQSIACIRELGLDINKVNVNGGSIAIGHPLGCSGARISTTLLYELKRRKAKMGLATMCVGVGQGASIIYESI